MQADEEIRATAYREQWQGMSKTIIVLGYIRCMSYQI